MALDEDAARLARSKSLATVVTLMPDGQPQAQQTWVDHDGDHVLINTEPQRQRARNLRRDPRVTVLLHSSDDPMDWAEVRGHVVDTVGGQRAREHADKLSQRYLGVDFDDVIGPDGRIILVIAADKVTTPRSLGQR